MEVTKKHPKKVTAVDGNQKSGDYSHLGWWKKNKLK